MRQKQNFKLAIKGKTQFINNKPKNNFKKEKIKLNNFQNK